MLGLNLAGNALIFGRRFDDLKQDFGDLRKDLKDDLKGIRAELATLNAQQSAVQPAVERMLIDCCKKA